MLKFISAIFIGLVISNSYAQSDGDYVRLVAELDEPEFYCFDLAGWGQSLRLEDPLQTHTCKARNAADQMLQFEDGHLKVAEYDRCIEVAGSPPTTLPGSSILARECKEDNGLQKLSLNANGQIQLAETPYCIVAGNDSREASGPSHMWRTLVLDNCEGADENLSTWQVGLD